MTADRRFTDSAFGGETVDVLAQDDHTEPCREVRNASGLDSPHGSS